MKRVASKGKNLFVAAALFSCLAVSQGTVAVTAGYWTKFVSLVEYPGSYGGCYAAVAITLSASGKGFSSDCNDNYVAFNCEGLGPTGGGDALNSKAEGRAKWAQAQLAHVSKALAYVTVDDTKRLNGICWAKATQVSVPQS